MGLYNVVAPCVVKTATGALKHHTRPAECPVELDDTHAAGLVEAGKVQPYNQPDAHLTVDDGRTESERFADEEAQKARDELAAAAAAGEEFAAAFEDTETPEDPEPVKRGRRRKSDDAGKADGVTDTSE